MTSKYILLLGSLLFVLLVTSCIAFFLDRYHPNLTMQVPEQRVPLPATEKRDQNIAAGERSDLFLHEIPINTLIETPERNETLKSIPHKTASAVTSKTKIATPTVSAVLTSERNVTHTSTQRRPSTQTIHTPKKTTPKNRTQATISQKLSLSQESSISKVQPETDKKHPKPLSRNRQKVIIEPVLLVKSLLVSPSGSLYRWDKPFLNDVARLVKENSESYVLLKEESLLRRSRTYLQHIRHYLISHGVPKSRIQSEEKPLSKEENIQSTFHDLTIELSVIERN